MHPPDPETQSQAGQKKPMSEIIQQGAEEGVLSIVGAKYSLGGEVTFFGE